MYFAHKFHAQINAYWETCSISDYKCLRASVIWYRKYTLRHQIKHALVCTSDLVVWKHNTAEIIAFAQRRLRHVYKVRKNNLQTWNGFVTLMAIKIYQTQMSIKFIQQTGILCVPWKYERHVKRKFKVIASV